MFAWLAVDVHRSDLQAVALRVDRFVRAEAEDLKGLGQLEFAVVGHTEFGIDVERDFRLNRRSAVGVRHFFMSGELQGFQIENGLKRIARQTVWDGQFTLG